MTDSGSMAWCPFSLAPDSGACVPTSFLPFPSVALAAAFGQIVEAAGGEDSRADDVQNGHDEPAVATFTPWPH
jgi:hypothetical protein